MAMRVLSLAGAAASSDDAVSLHPARARRAMEAAPTTRLLTPTLRYRPPASVGSMSSRSRMNRRHMADRSSTDPRTQRHESATSDGAWHQGTPTIEDVE